MPLSLRYAARSDVGLVRPGNEDSGYAGSCLLAVADGMGGHAAGELASAAAIATLSSLDDDPPSSSEALASLADAVDRIGGSIGNVVATDPELTGMGTTTTGLFWMSGRIALVHVGDSRAYLLRDGELMQMTHDHTYVQTLVDAGRITAEEATIHPRRSLLMRALDGNTPVEADLSVREARLGDRYLLCSDGLTSVVPDEAIAQILLQHDPTGCVTALVDAALENGAPDNVTVVVADVIEAADVTAQAPVVVGAAGEPRVRSRLPQVIFPSDAQPDHDLAVVADRRTLPMAAHPVRRGRRRRLIGLGSLIVLVLIVGASLVATQAFIASRWFVGSTPNDTVGLFQGLPQSLFSWQLFSEVEDTGIPISSLPGFDADLVRSKSGQTLGSIEHARDVIADLRLKAGQCASADPPIGCPTGPPTSTGSADPTNSADPTTTVPSATSQ